MKIIKLNRETANLAPCVATIGFFDGVHKGHRFLINHVIQEAADSELQSDVITFDRHPREVLQSDYIPQILSGFDRKMSLLADTGVDNGVVVHFDKEMASLSSYEFMRDVLRDKLNVKKLVIGYDNRFGHNCDEGFDDYVRYGKELGIEVIHNQAFVLNGVNVSSSVIRSLLKDGEVEMAEMCLGYYYTIVGKVVHGYKQGRKMGFPTANLDMTDSHQLVPSPGVYAVKVHIDGEDECRNGMMNIGKRPTFGGDNITLETNIFDFAADIYDKIMSVSFIHRIREERKFNNAIELAGQLKDDRRLVEEQFLKED
ncbi:bifunctional riboflavin kinase/FAD synthetase [Segatella paludivivens]|uniref:bifunctional riboflavin kinase/FAD synthetase n=1 Tax=Segatella paludivivens TaxID=185294 RepID=UPI0003812654|nr:bifunctional riboflavin kinase/FAD synthetase [Segatella paludivivens]